LPVYAVIKTNKKINRFILIKVVLIIAAACIIKGLLPSYCLEKIVSANVF